MDLQSVLKAVINSRGMGYKDLSVPMGVSIQGISGYLNRRNSMSVATLIKLLNILGYELVIRDKSHENSAWVIENATSKMKEV